MGNGVDFIATVSYLVVSLLTHVAELGFNIYYIYHLWYYGENGTILFYLVIGFTAVPVMIVQLTSAILAVKRMGSNLKVLGVIKTAFLHTLQLGFITRHFQIMFTSNKSDTKTQLSDLYFLRIIHSFSSGLPLLIIYSYYILRYSVFECLILSLVITVLLSTSWGISNFRSHSNVNKTEQVVLPWPRLLIRYIGKICEIVSRILVLVTFALVYHYWIFLVFSSHWLCMTICVVTYVIGIRPSEHHSRCHCFLISVIIGYTSIFCFVDCTIENTKRIYIIYYTVMFLENTMLTFSWILTLQGEIPFLSYTLIFVIMGCFSLSVILTFTDMRCYYSKLSVSSIPSSTAQSNDVKHQCLNCKQGNCKTHSEKHLQCDTASVMKVNKPMAENENFERKHKEVKFMQDAGFVKPIGSAKPASCMDLTSSPSQISKSRDQCLPVSRTPTLPEQTQQKRLGKSRYANDDHSNTSKPSRGTLSVSARSSRTSTGYSCSECECSCCCNSCHSYDTYSMDTTSTIRNFYRSDNSLLTDRCNSATEDHRHNIEKKTKITNQSREELNRDWYSDGYSTDRTLDSYKISQAHARKTAKKHSRSSPGVNKGTQCCICELTEKPEPTYANRAVSGKPQKKSRHLSTDSDSSNVFDSLKQLSLSTPDISFSKHSRLESIAEDNHEHVLKQYVFPKNQVSALDVKAPWYASSDSGDSAFPQETFTCSSPDAPVFSDADSFASMEMVI